jgi:hypothetical protein
MSGTRLRPPVVLLTLDVNRPAQPNGAGLIWILACVVTLSWVRQGRRPGSPVGGVPLAPIGSESYL